MDDKRYESPENLQAFLDAVSQHLEPLVAELQDLVKTVTPILGGVISEFVKWDFSDKVLGKAGWLPHYTTPFDYIAECGKDDKAVQSQLLDYYENNWQNVRSEVEARLSGYKIDSEAKATFREALDAHEAGLYRCVCRVLFPEIERVLRTELFDDEIRSRPITFKDLTRKLVCDDQKAIDDFILSGLYDLSIFGYMTKAIREKDEEPVSESDKLIFGLFTNVKNEEHRESLKQSAIPNRHAAIHGLVIYSSQQNSLNMIFLADYIFQVISSSKNARR